MKPLPIHPGIRQPGNHALKAIREGKTVRDVAEQKGVTRPKMPVPKGNYGPRY